MRASRSSSVSPLVGMGAPTLTVTITGLTTALPSDSIIGRLAGDEFAVIVDGNDARDDRRQQLDELARTLLDRLADPFYVQGHEVFMTASMGIARYPDDAPNVIDLIRNADAALYHAKKSGGNIHAYYVPEMNEAAVERLMTKSKLKRSFERDELLVHYQPKYNIVTGEVVDTSGGSFRVHVDAVWVLGTLGVAMIGFRGLVFTSATGAKLPRR